jgi:dTDP-4-amino-4,6-dideoxygalactose transaminase
VIPVRKNHPEIGSDFWQIDNEKHNDSKLWWETKPYKHQYFKSGRNAIKALCQITGRESTRVLLPVYTCETVIQPFLDEGWDVEYYYINKNLSINLKDFLKKINTFKPDVVYFQSYFGFDTLAGSETLVNELHDRKIFVVEDITQSLFSSHFIEKADYYVTSFRKFFAIPDGGCLFSATNSIDIAKKISDSRILQTAMSAFEKKRKYFENPSADKKEEFRKQYQILNQLISDNDDVSDISNESINVIEGCDKDFIQQKRKVNHDTLYAGLKEVDKLICIFDCTKDDETPLYLPVYVESLDRKELQRELAERNIYCPVIWPKPNEIDCLDESAKYIYENILCFPIDQRYDEEDMMWIISTLKEILEN